MPSKSAFRFDLYCTWSEILNGLLLCITTIPTARESDTLLAGTTTDAANDPTATNIATVHITAAFFPAGGGGIAALAVLCATVSASAVTTGINPTSGRTSASFAARRTIAPTTFVGTLITNVTTASGAIIFRAAHRSGGSISFNTVVPFVIAAFCAATSDGVTSQ